MHRRTDDGRTDGTAISISRVSIAVLIRNKKVNTPTRAVAPVPDSSYS